MANHPWLPGVEVTITVKDTPLIEYNDPDLQSDVFGAYAVTKYVESKADEKFSICIGFDETAKKLCPIQGAIGGALEFEVHIDGKEIQSEVYSGDDLESTRHYVSGENTSSTTIRPFQFTGLQISTDDRSKPNYEPQTLASIGTIEIRQYCATVRRDTSPPRDFTLSTESTIGLKEKDMKGKDSKSLEVTLGEVEECESATWVECERCPGPATLFRFFYRSKEDLKRLGILPRTRSPTPLMEKSLDGLDAEQLRELILQHRAELVVSSVRVKKEPMTTNTVEPTACASSVPQHKCTTYPVRVDEKDDDDVQIVYERPVKRQKCFPDAEVDVVALE